MKNQFESDGVLAVVDKDLTKSNSVTKLKFDFSNFCCTSLDNGVKDFSANGKFKPTKNGFTPTEEAV